MFRRRKPRYSRDYSTGYLILILCVLVPMLWIGMSRLWKEKAECESRGGAYVRSFIGYTCVGRY